MYPWSDPGVDGRGQDAGEPEKRRSTIPRIVSASRSPSVSTELEMNGSGPQFLQKEIGSGSFAEAWRTWGINTGEEQALRQQKPDKATAIPIARGEADILAAVGRNVAFHENVSRTTLVTWPDTPTFTKSLAVCHRTTSITPPRLHDSGLHLESVPGGTEEAYKTRRKLGPRVSTQVLRQILEISSGYMGKKADCYPRIFYTSSLPMLVCRSKALNLKITL